MGDFLSIVWTIVSFIVGIVWSIVWFIVRDLLSTLLWLLIAVWIVFVLRYRSFALGSLAMLRYTRYGLNFGLRWIRGRPADGVLNPAPTTKIVREYQRLIPLGYVSASEQINVILIGMLVIMANV